MKKLTSFFTKFSIPVVLALTLQGCSQNPDLDQRLEAYDKAVTTANDKTIEAYALFDKQGPTEENCNTLISAFNLYAGASGSYKTALDQELEHSDLSDDDRSIAAQKLQELELLDLITQARSSEYISGCGSDLLIPGFRL